MTEWSPDDATATAKAAQEAFQAAAEAAAAAARAKASMTDAERQAERERIRKMMKGKPNWSGRKATGENKQFPSGYRPSRGYAWARHRRMSAPK
jgi:membrane protein involved in colicin uptake